jgi:hypothetical protein
MKSKIWCISILFVLYGFSSFAQLTSAERSALYKKYNLIPDRSKDTQFYRTESKVLRYNNDGTRGLLEIYRLELRCVANKTGDQFTCKRFTIQSGNSPEISIPALVNWTYALTSNQSGVDEKGQLMGIDHSRFEQLTDSNGNAIPTERVIHVFNAFIDFHSMSVFADRYQTGKGVQDLSTIGQKVIHGASFSNPPVNLGRMIEKGSVFTNGEITMEFKGLGVINKKSCAILQYDSGESSFSVNMKLTSSMDVKTTGSSHYWGDIYKDLESGWIQKAVLNEIVVSQTEVTGQANKISTVIERLISIVNKG